MTDESLYRDEASDIYEAFGRFINRYSKVEEIIHVFFRYSSGMSIDAARVISSGMRVQDIIERIRKLNVIQERSEEFRQQINDIFCQFDTIGKLRHNLVHRSGNASKDLYITTNLITSKANNEYEMLLTKLSDIKNASKDLKVIRLKLFFIMNPDQHFFRQHPEESYSSYTWQYKHLVPTKLRKPHSSIPQLSEHQPKSSLK